jgi:hypothetical protein
MSAWRELSFIDAPVDSVWSLVGDPQRFPEWWPKVVDVQGENFVEGSEFIQVTRGPGSVESHRSRMHVERFDEELHEVRMQCALTGYYAHWRLTSGQGGTFADVEFGMEPERKVDRLFDVVLGKVYWRRWLNQSLRALQAAARARSGHA